MNKQPEIEVLVRGVCLKGGRLLVCRSRGAANVFLPGGHAEFMEQAAESLRREIREELGLEATIGAFLGAVEHTFIQKGERHCEINLVFRMRLPDLDPAQNPPALEHWIRFKWVPLHKLRAARLEPWPLQRLVPRWVQKPSRIPRWGSTIEP
jgi:8-oxo-dGTP pyrophosphatase MutT (NUDIX family)